MGAIINSLNLMVNAIRKVAPTIHDEYPKHSIQLHIHPKLFLHHLHLNAKKAVLKAIADHLEQKRKDGCYKGTSYNGLCEDLFAVFNNASIRHKNNKQWKLPKPARIKLYDQTFKAAIHLLQMEDMDAFQARVKELKKPPSNGNEAP